MDVIEFLLKTTIKLMLAVSGLVVSAVVYLINALTGSLARQARRNPAPQEGTPPPSPIRGTHQRATPTPAVTVHVHVTAEPSAPAPVETQPAAPSTKSPSLVLNQPDHAIYVTTGSHLMMQHPDSERLLEALDQMLYVGAHRDGKPFTVAPSLDNSPPAEPVQLPPLADFDVNVFEPTEPRPMPAPDGAMWSRRAGTNPTPLPAGTSR